ncbi:hypothetical protein IMG5_097040 [Ichthyophthirius multifiliis]|uniref:Uncharacterized protein n=1 Tax=Ichthyophthirius multifiliis TaxID=5932 RepID=G0QRQ5_ICHMU|nr:hypothetical protein IMG5_097040 [Ichthyophthirius multifiliis]EGR32090.1 hypothetical protein IMG5_097040 [Ichthyophthirius multifiliis]|eukprot:XP_004035576.1 hypothetical protein IMG5_097040 [Ichthyophthirius multifiliis]
MVQDQKEQNIQKKQQKKNFHSVVLILVDVVFQKVNMCHQDILKKKIQIKQLNTQKTHLMQNIFIFGEDLWEQQVLYYIHKNFRKTQKDQLQIVLIQIYRKQHIKKQIYLIFQQNQQWRKLENKYKKILDTISQKLVYQKKSKKQNKFPLCSLFLKKIALFLIKTHQKYILYIKVSKKNYLCYW